MLYRASGVWQSPFFIGNALKAAAAAIKNNQARFASTDTEVTIGNVSNSYAKPKTPQFVPRKYLPEKKSQKALQHLRWMLQKDLLGQDMFLIGRPGPERRRLALEFLELTGREVEFVTLSRDTTEADLKQRRELRNGTAEFFDQSAVRAATEGRVLVLEGVEKAERNVLPVLNNLLENREMHLEDGRFLVPADRYDKLLKENSQEELDRWRLVRVSEDFRVIALGVPVPRYPGNPLDPPLRSRFQARSVGTETFKVPSRPLSPSAPTVIQPPKPPTRHPHPRLSTPPSPPPPPPPIALCDRVIQWLDLAKRFPQPSAQPLPPVQTTGQFARPRVVASAQRTPPPTNTSKRRVMTARRSASFGDTLPLDSRPAVIQVYRTPPPAIPLRAWISDTPRTKPQLHIFVPAVERKRLEEELGESNAE